MLVMQPNTTAIFSFQMTQAAVYYGGIGTCNFNTTVNYAVRSHMAALAERAGFCASASDCMPTRDAVYHIGNAWSQGEGAWGSQLLLDWNRGVLN